MTSNNDSASAFMGINRKHIIILLIITVFEIIIHWGTFFHDSNSYISTMNYFLGHGERIEKRMLRPLTVILAAPLAGIIGDINAFALINSIFWIFSVLLMYKFSLNLLKSPTLSFYSSFLFTTSIPTLSFCAGVLTDAGGYFFTLFVLYILIYGKQDKLTEYLWTGIILALAVLAREHIALTIFLFLFFHDIVFHRNYKRILILIPLTALFVFPYYYMFHIDIFSPFTHARAGNFQGTELYFSEAYSIKFFINSFAGAFLFLPLFSILGFLYEKNKEDILLYYSLFLSIFPFIVVWPAFSNRFTFLLFPVIISLASLGMRYFFRELEKKPVFSMIGYRKYEILTLLVYAFISNIYVFHDFF